MSGRPEPERGFRHVMLATKHTTNS